MTLNSLMHLYVACGFVDEAYKLLEKLPERNVVVWSTLINGCARSGRPKEAMAMFVRMVSEGWEPNDVTMISVLSACGDLGDLLMAKWTHCLVEN